MSDVRSLIRARDWSAAPLGPASEWPAALRELLATVLACPVPMAIFWGGRLVALYNDAFAGLLGDAHPEALGTDVRAGQLGASARALACIERVMECGEPVSRVDPGLGPRAPFLSLSPIRADGWREGDEISGVLAVAQSYEEKRGDALQLEATEALFRATFLQAVVGMAITTPSGKWLAINDSYPRLFGYTGDEVAQQKVFDATAPDLSEVHGAELERLLRGEISAVVGEMRYRHKNGQTVWGNTQISLIRGDLGEPLFLFWVIQDITARKRAMERAERLQVVTSALSRGVSVLEVAKILLAEGMSSLRASVGWVARVSSPGGVLEIILSEGLPDGLRKRWHQSDAYDALLTPTVWRTGEAQFPSESELRERFPETARQAKRVDVSTLIALPLKLEDRVLAVLGLGFQTPRQLSSDERAFIDAVAGQCAQAMERALLFEREQQRSEELADAVRARDAFLSIASHELKTPLTPLRMRVQALARFAPKMISDEEARTWLLQQIDSIEKYGDRLDRLLDELLDVSRIVGGRLRMELERMDLAEVVREVVLGLEERGDVARSGCSVQVDAEGPVVGRWDRLRLEQVATNLISNALKYGARGPVDVRVRAEGAEATLVVEDHGIGIAPEARERIFGRFERAVSARNFGGFGLGLYITRQIVDALEGQIEVASELGRGTTFTVSLPSAGPTTEVMRADFP